MAVLFKNPHLEDYFLEVPEVTAGSPPARPYVPEFEAGKVLLFPNLKFDIDHQFWADLPTDQLPKLKKFACHADRDIELALRKAQTPRSHYDDLKRNIEGVLQQALPIYHKLFEGYSFTNQGVCFRLNTTMNENIHFDCYRDAYPDHFARMFINLDTQPRIWHTGYTVHEIRQKYGANVDRKTLTTADINRWWHYLNSVAHDGAVESPRPKHVAYFDPGDVWAVDSRQISHQIFYGRRAVSIDFFVSVDSMLDPGKHYLAMAERFRSELLAGGP